MSVRETEAVRILGQAAEQAAEPGEFAAEARAARERVAGVRRRRRLRWTAVTAALALLALAVFCLALAYGDVVLPLGDVLGALFGQDAHGAHFIVVELRLPRALIGLLVGVAFGASGAIFQALLRNPLASPDIIGVSNGASAAAVLASLTFAVSGFGLSLAAFVGALGTAAAIYALAWRKGVSGYRFALIGIGLGAGLLSVTSYLLTSSRVTEAQQALVWLTGSLNGSALSQLWPLAVALAVLLPLTWLAARAMGPLQLGDEAAAGLGARVERSRLLLLFCAVALAGVATAAAGPVNFVAFLAAPIARRLVPGQGAALVPAALTGGVLVVLADFAAQHLLWSNQFPVGVVTSLVGAPYLLFLLARANRSGSGG